MVSCSHVGQLMINVLMFALQTIATLVTMVLSFTKMQVM